MQKHPDYTRERLKQLADRMRLKIYPETRPAAKLLVSKRQDERISYADAQKLKDFKQAKIGDQFGPLWATYWFRGQAAIPKEWKGDRVDLLWGSHSEATLWIDGVSVQGLNHTPMAWDGSTRSDAILIKKAKGGEAFDFQIEMACNKLFGYEENYAPHYKSISAYVLDQCDIARFDQEAWDLYFDFMVLQTLESDSLKDDLDKTWAGRLLSELNRFANIYNTDDHSTWKPARKILTELYKNTNSGTTHELSAIGHAHIDTAWLWPLAETQRKCERTFSSQTTYMEDYPEYKFSCSQAQQYTWIKERNPDLYKKIKARAKTGQWVPVGGTWIEPDCNIPSGESLVRQFLYGQRFFEKEFGKRCREFWNPDVFGYNGQLPQILKGAGIERFNTQKLSWNRFNKPAHHTFLWEGIDGSQVFTHFPPVDTYNADCAVPQLRDNVRKYKDHDRSRNSLILFGYGDGGGGPTKTMLEILRRTKDLQGVPKITQRTSDDFFTRLQEDCTDPMRMVGELYFEYHRGTYTSQAATKRGNRKSEVLLHDTEMLFAIASLKSGKPPRYPHAEIDRLWKLVLLNQFHDILPGTSIQLVYEDTAQQYADVETSATLLIEHGLQAVCGQSSKSSERKNGSAIFNSTGIDRAEVIETDSGKLAWAEAPSCGTGHISTTTESVVLMKGPGGSYVLENSFLRATVNKDGTLSSLIHNETERETLFAPGNQFLMYRDEPTAWQAWDVDPQHLETEMPCPPAKSCRVITEDGLRIELEFKYQISEKALLKQIIRLNAGSRRLEFHTEVEWYESNRFLKVAFPVNVRAMNATYEMQFGSVDRPTHFNTSYDLARYEVPAHRWSDLSEHGFGVALLNDCKYGYSTFNNIMRLSLLRAPKHPDPQCDMGKHNFTYAIMPHAGNWREAGVVREGISLNYPLHVASASALLEAQSWFRVDDPAGNLLIDTVKKAEDSDDIIVRLYEAHGARGEARLLTAMPFNRAKFCNLLEDDGNSVTGKNSEWNISYAPYQIITIKLSRK